MHLIGVFRLEGSHRTWAAASFERPVRAGSRIAGDESPSDREELSRPPKRGDG